MSIENLFSQFNNQENTLSANKREMAEISDSEFMKLKEIFGLPNENIASLKWEVDNNFDPRGLESKAVLE